MITSPAAEWALNIKIRAGWSCQRCGELDRRVLDSHHKKSKAQFPELAEDFDNGECLCLACHALAHRNDPEIARLILARLGIILYCGRNKAKKEKLMRLIRKGR